MKVFHCVDYENETEVNLQNYAKTKEKFIEMLLKRFQDKSAFCRTKVIKVFLKLTEESMVPKEFEMELFANVINRLKDTAIYVRKGALRLFQQMVVIFGVKFAVDRTDPDRNSFKSMNVVIHDAHEI
jgi:hypothetical protein